MRLHDSVDLALSHPQRPGRLPLSSATVRSVFTDHQLPASLATALRALAHDQSEGPAVSYATNGSYYGRNGDAPDDGPEPRSSGWRGSRHRRIRERDPLPSAPRAEQLSLFG